MATILATPGVYIQEKSSFGSSVVPVQTAVPAFIGYTQKASRGSKDLTNVPTRISHSDNLRNSLAEHQKPNSILNLTILM